MNICWLQFCSLEREILRFARLLSHQTLLCGPLWPQWRPILRRRTVVTIPRACLWHKTSIIAVSLRTECSCACSNQLGRDPLRVPKARQLVGRPCAFFWELANTGQAVFSSGKFVCFRQTRSLRVWRGVAWSQCCPRTGTRTSCQKTRGSSSDGLSVLESGGTVRVVLRTDGIEMHSFHETHERGIT